MKLQAETETATPTSTPSRTPEASPSPPAGVILSLVPAATTTAINGTFDIVIQVMAGSTPIDSVAAYINFDPSLLRVEQITPGSALSTILQNTFNNTSGRINFAAGTFSSFPTGTFDVATIRFQALAPTLQTALSFANAIPRQTDVFSSGNSVLSGVQEAVVTVSNTFVEVSVTLQGRPAPPNTRWSVPLNVVVLNDTTGAIAYEDEVSTDQNGIFTLTGLPPGPYQIWIKHAHTLAILQTITIVSGTQSVNAGVLPEGDANNDNSVTIVDFSILAATFGLIEGESGYDERADFNEDGAITIADFSLLALNFNQVGAPILMETPTATATATMTASMTPTATWTPSMTPTATRTASMTWTVTMTRTPTATRTPSMTPTATRTPTMTMTRTITMTPSPSWTPLPPPPTASGGGG